jgi:hypothetical protein
MKEEIKYNLNAYLSKNSKKEFYITLLTIILFIFLLIFINIYKINDVYEVTGQTICENDTCKIYFYQYNFDNIKYDFCKINNESYEIADLTYSEFYLNEQNISYQEVVLSLKNYQGKNNEIVKLKFNKDKETLLKKIKEIILER